MAAKNSTAPISGHEARARLREARVYLTTAELYSTSDEAAERKVSGANAVLAGIAAADAICGIVLGERSAGDDHMQAVALVKRATQPATKAANSLKRLLTEKTPTQYGVAPLSATDAAALVKWARDVVAEAEDRAR